MKHLTAKILTIIMLILAAALGGCTDNAPVTNPNADITIVTDNFAVYDWTRNVIGDVNAELVLLGANGADMHSYQPIAHDFAMLKDCDLCIYIGGESDSWVADAMQQTSSGAYSMPLLNVIDNVQIEQDPIGMAADDHDHADTGEPELDEHIWLSLKNAITCTNAIADKLADIDPANADIYRTNADNYCAELTALDGEYATGGYAQTIATAAYDTILVADRFPFIYLVEDYNLNWYAAYPGCSAETGASFETVKFLSDKLAEHKLPAVIVCENADTALAETIIATSGQSGTAILALDSLQSVNQADIDAGKTYIGAMTENLAVLKSALN